MRSLALICLASVALTGCESMGNLTSPAPLQRTVIDDRAVRYAFLGLDTLATLADAAMDSKLVVPGTPLALTLADGLEKTKYWLNAASRAQKAGSLLEYNRAFEEASKAMALVKKALGGKFSALPVAPKQASVSGTVLRLRAA